jgi:hypothetical protein
LENLQILVEDLINNSESLEIINRVLNLNCRDLYLFEEIVKVLKYIINNNQNEIFENKKKLILDFINTDKIRRENNEDNSENNIEKLKEY